MCTGRLEEQGPATEKVETEGSLVIPEVTLTASLGYWRRSHSSCVEFLRGEEPGTVGSSPEERPLDLLFG